MKIETDTAMPIREIETQWIVMGDGCKLAARIWLPTNAETVPVPAILEYIPYRRRDGTAISDASRQPYIAGHGYASVRVDIRGTGDSDGIILDEYTDLEHEDACTVIKWLSEQPWCNGNVGMWGISWGGFASLQVAAKCPPALKAIIALCASDDRYADDAHYLGGCLIEANLRWGTRFFSETARPPDPEVVGPGWRDMWFDRMNNLDLFPDIWMQHQARDDYWKRASACEEFGNIKAAVMAVGGWSDAYVNSVGTTLAGVTSPKMGLIGPWGHDYPHVARPSPAIGFLQEALRWWGYWLKGEDTGIMDEPLLRAWSMNSIRPSTTRTEIAGEWISNASWPATDTDWRHLYLNTDGLGDDTGAEETICHTSPTTTGIEGGEWNVWGSGAEFGGDQRPDDGQSLCFDTQPLARDVDLFGGPVVSLTFSVDQPLAIAAVRLCDIWPDGASNRVTFGLMNLTHGDSHEFPTHLVTGKEYTIKIPLRDIAYVVPAGHRLRVAISTTYWPLVWPSPEPVCLSLKTAQSYLSLPVRGNKTTVNSTPQFSAATGTSLVTHDVIRSPNSTRNISRDVNEERTTYTVVRDAGAARLTDTDVLYGNRGEAVFDIVGNDPLSASHTERQVQILEREGWRIRIEAETNLSATRLEFLMQATVRAFEGDEQVFEKKWQRETPRNCI